MKQMWLRDDIKSSQCFFFQAYRAATLSYFVLPLWNIWWYVMKIHGMSRQTNSQRYFVLLFGTNLKLTSAGKGTWQTVPLLNSILTVEGEEGEKTNNTNFRRPWLSPFCLISYVTYDTSMCQEQIERVKFHSVMKSYAFLDIRSRPCSTQARQWKKS